MKSRVNLPELLKAQARIDRNISQGGGHEPEPFDIETATKKKLIEHAKKEGIEIDSSARIDDIRKVISEA